MSPESYGLQMLHLLREHLVGARFSYNVYGTRVTNTQSALLSEIARRDSPSIEELCVVLKLHASTVSRTLRQLEKWGMISSKRSATDKRRILHQCSDKGRAFAEFSWSSQQEIIAKRLRAFSAVERQQLESFLRIFVGDAAFGRIVPVKGEPLLAVIFRGLTYDHGVVSGSYVGSGFSASDWLILSEIHYNQRSPGELSRLMSAGKGTVSLRLKSLQTRGMITSRKDPDDNRGRILSLTIKGARCLDTIERLGEEYFNRALAPISEPATLALGFTLFTRYVYSLNRSLVLTARVVALRNEELARAREEARRVLPTLPRDYPTSGYLLHEENFVGRVSPLGISPFIMECVREGRSRLRLANIFSCDGSPLPFSSSDLTEVVRDSLKKTLRIDDEWRHFIDRNELTAAPTTSE